MDIKSKREKMVLEIREKYGLSSPEILSVMLQIPRHRFVEKKYGDIAYSDGPVPIGYGQTMSQPYTVAFMTHLLLGKQIPESGKANGVLEIGTGSGYQAAILSKFFQKVFTIEIVRELSQKAKETLKRLGFNNVFVKEGSGESGWVEKAPFNAIIVTAGLGENVPETLFDQLIEGGILVAPVGAGLDKKMTRFVKKDGKVEREEFGIFHFVPFV
jgi:protein-L-isoaspartate(D-aspartate) O-methyltransferase